MGTVQGCTTYARIGIWQWMLLVYMNLTTASMFPYFFTAFAWSPPQYCHSNRCNRNGRCEETPWADIPFQCHCFRGFMGRTCEFREPSPPRPSGNGCDSRPCRNGGICHNKPSRPQGYYCNCKYDWNGYNCEIWVGRPFNCALKRNGNFEDPFQCPAPHFYQCAGSAGWLSRCDTGLFYDVSNPTSWTPSSGVGWIRNSISGTKSSNFAQHPDAGPREVWGWWGASPGVRRSVRFSWPAVRGQIMTVGFCF